MAKDIVLVKNTAGEKVDDSQKQELNVEKMLAGLLRSLLDEQRPAAPPITEPNEQGGHA